MGTETVLDGITTGLVTSEMLEAKPYGFRVTWMKWDSGFRGTALRVGDRILGVDGWRYDPSKRTEFVHKAIGNYAEDQHWAKVSARDGQKAVLTVWREGDEMVEIAGSVRAERIYANDAGRRCFGQDGPDQLSSDGFSDGAWSGWYERLVNRESRVLDGGWLTGINNRMLLSEMLDERARIELLVSKYPGQFASTVKADWDAVVESLRGTRYELTADDLAYRTLGEQRSEEIAAAGKSAWEAFVAKSGAVQLDSLPAVDPIRGDRTAIVGKTVELPELGNRDWIAEAGHGFMVAEGSGGTRYLVDTGSKPLARVYSALYRFEKLVTPHVDETHRIVGRVASDPKMVVSGGTIYTGFLVEALADLLGRRVFVDATGEGEEPAFAGEELLHKPGPVALADDAPPEKVMAALSSALKLGDEELWKSLFATWSCEPWEDKVYFKAWDPPSASTLSQEWIHARTRILDRVYDLRVARVHPARLLMDGSEFEGAPKVAQALVEMDPIGLFDGEYRAFKDVEVHRVWFVQRVNRGPWRVSSVQGI